MQLETSQTIFFCFGMALLPSGLFGPSRGTIAARPTLPIDQ